MSRGITLLFLGPRDYMELRGSAPRPGGRILIYIYIYIYIYIDIKIYTGSAKKMYTRFNERKLYVV